MTKQEKAEKRSWFFFLIGYFAAGYLLINWISSNRGAFFDVSTNLDFLIPFSAPFIFGYILVYLSILLTYLITDDIGDWRRASVSFFTATTLAYIIFLVFPVRMEMRHDLTSSTGISFVVTRYYYLIDMPYNCFPSLHVTYPALATLVAWRNHKFMRWIFVAMTIIVAVSVVFVKQHYIADVAAGFLNGVLCFWLAVKLESAWSQWFKPLNAEL